VEIDRLPTDEDLDRLQVTTLQYYLHETNPANGLIRDKTDPAAPCSIAAVGLGLATIPVLIERGVISREFAPEIALRRLRFFHNSPHSAEPDSTGYKGFYYHFLDMKNGRRVWECELSTIDSAFLFAGMLICAAYFDADTEEVSDITERKRAEQASQRGELLNRELIEHMREGLAYCKMLFENGLGSDFVYVMVNERFEILTGLKDVTGKRVTEVIPGIRELDPGLFETYARVSKTGVAEKFEMFLNSLEQWYSVSVYSPEKGFFIAIFDVIDERKRMEDALRQSEARLLLAAKSTNMGTFDFDPRTGKLIWSDVSKAYFGLPPDAEVDDATFRKGLHPDDRERVQRMVEQAMRPENYGEYASEFRTIGISDGKERWLSACGRVLFDHQGQPERFVGLMLDISEKKRQEKLAETYHRDIRALAANLLTAQEDERRRVSRDLHDQICQQLGFLAGDMRELVASPLPEDTQRQLEALQARVVKVAEETRHIAYELHTAIIDDLGLVASLRDLCEQFSERNPSIALKFTGEVLPAVVPREAASCLYRVTQEALQNIANHSDAKHVSVALSWQKGSILLSLEDDGAGFDPEVVRGRGGLGLISMQERVRLVKGKLTITAQPGRGAQIAVEIPLPGRNL